MVPLCSVLLKFQAIVVTIDKIEYIPTQGVKMTSLSAYLPEELSFDPLTDITPLRAILRYFDLDV